MFTPISIQVITSFVICWKGMLAHNVYLFVDGLRQIVQDVWNDGTCKGCRGKQSDLVWGIIWVFTWTEEILIRSNLPKLDPLLISVLTYILTYFTYLLTYIHYILTYLLTLRTYVLCILTYSLTFLHTYLLTYFLSFLHTYLLTHSITFLHTYLPTYLLTYLLT